MKELVEYEKTGKKPQKSNKKFEYCLEEKTEQPNYAQIKKHEKLINSLKRLTVEEEYEELKEDV